MIDIQTAQFVMGFANLMLTTLVAVLTSVSFKSRCRRGHGIDVSVHPISIRSPSSSSSSLLGDRSPPNPRVSRLSPAATINDGYGTGGGEDVPK